MPMRAQKWAIGFVGFLAALAFGVSGNPQETGEVLGIAFAFGVFCGLISILRSYTALLTIAAASACFMLLGLSAMNSPSDGRGMAGTMFHLVGLFLGAAATIALISKALFAQIKRSADHHGNRPL